MKAPRTAAAALAALGFAAAALAAAAPASADYGSSQAYQIALSDNLTGPQGGGVWIWWELNSDHTGDYSGSDCGHGQGAAADKGDVTWQYSADGTQIYIYGTVLNGLGGYPTTVVIPSAYGHYAGTDETFLTLPPFLGIPAGIGNAQLQVAP